MDVSDMPFGKWKSSSFNLGQSDAPKKKRVRPTPVVSKKPVYKRQLQILRGPGFPTGLQTKLKYSDIIGITCTSGTPATYSWRGNSVYDPDFTSTGHQPLYYDQLTAIYNRYRVDGCKLKFTACTDGDTPMAVVVVPNDSGEGFATIGSACERKFSVERTVTKEFPQLMKTYAASNKIMGMTKDKYRDDDLNSAQYDANPTNIWYWNLITQTVNGSSTGTLRITLCLTYYVSFFEPKQIGQS